MAWDSMSKQFDVVLDFPKDSSCATDYTNAFTECLTKLDSLGYLYFAILHDNDIDEFGKNKHLHYHLVLIGNTRKRCSTITYQLQDLIRLDNGASVPLIESIHVQPLDNIALSIQYLTHKNSPRKYQYDFHNVLTNSIEVFNTYYFQEVSVIKINEYVLFNLVDQGYTECEILFKVGLGNFSTYKNVIRMLLNEHQYKWRWEKVRMLYSDGEVKDE